MCHRSVGTMTIIKDTTGRNWLVLKGDPAYDLVHDLTKQGFKQIVLSLSAAATGEIGVPSPQSVESLAEAYDETGDESVRMAFLLAATAYDCAVASRRTNVV